jgi:predicted peptidase
MRKTVLTLAAVLIVLPAALRAQAPKEKVAQLLEKKTFEDGSGKVLRYRLLKPENYDPKKNYPLVVFLHGAGERGEDNEKQLVHGVPEFAKGENRKKYPCFLIAPQCPAGKRWSDVDPLVLGLIAALPKDYSIDPKRIYLTGLSLGGFGTWDLLARRPDLFAAAVPICGGGNAKQAAKFAKIPIWVFHGAKDPAVKVSRSRDMVKALEEAGGHPKYTEYPDQGHASWVPAYRDPEMMKWLFAQKRG